MSDNQSVICPILSISTRISEIIGTNINTVLCQGNECAWWDKSNKCCIIHGLSDIVCLRR